jgi:hypothetical protein
MRYLFSQTTVNSTTLVIVKDPTIQNGTVYATKIGEFAGWNNARERVYQSCTPVQFIAGGGPWTLTEFTDPLI